MSTLSTKYTLVPSTSRSYRHYHFEFGSGDRPTCLPVRNGEESAFGIKVDEAGTDHVYVQLLEKQEEPIFSNKSQVDYMIMRLENGLSFPLGEVQDASVYVDVLPSVIDSSSIHQVGWIKAFVSLTEERSHELKDPSLERTMSFFVSNCSTNIDVFSVHRQELLVKLTANRCVRRVEEKHAGSLVGMYWQSFEEKGHKMIRAKGFVDCDVVAKYERRDTLNAVESSGGSIIESRRSLNAISRSECKRSRTG